MAGATKPGGMSSITNGRRLLHGGGARSVWGRRFRDVLALYISDAGGDNMVSEAQRSILRRAAVIQTELERIEAGFAEHGQAPAGDLDEYAKVSAVLSRLLEKVGFDRKARDVTPSINEFLADHARQKAVQASAPVTVTLEPVNLDKASPDAPILPPPPAFVLPPPPTAPAAPKVTT